MTTYYSIVTNKLEPLPSNRTPNCFTPDQTARAERLVKETASAKTLEEIHINFRDITALIREVGVTNESIFAADRMELMFQLNKASRKWTRLENKLAEQSSSN